MPATKSALGTVMKQLEKMGTAQNRKVYVRHGVTGPQFGVSYANMGKLAKQIKVDHDLAVALWESGNHDARILATMVVDPDKISAAQVDAWAKDLENYVLTDAFAKMVGNSRFIESRIGKWTKASNEWIGQAGYNLLAIYAGRGDVPDTFFQPWIGTIERQIHGGKNRVRYAMNTALISIGIRGGALQKQATAAAKRIGRVDVDHGETGCKTPDAAPYIAKAVAYRKAKAKGKKR